MTFLCAQINGIILVLLNWSAAFNSTHRAFLVDRWLKRISSRLSERHFRIHTKSSSAPLFCGIPQSSILGPIMFSLHTILILNHLESIAYLYFSVNPTKGSATSVNVSVLLVIGCLQNSSVLVKLRLLCSSYASLWRLFFTLALTLATSHHMIRDLVLFFSIFGLTVLFLLSNKHLALISIQWNFEFIFKILVTYKALHCKSPAYTATMLTPYSTSQPGWSLETAPWSYFKSRGFCSTYTLEQPSPAHQFWLNQWFALNLEW